MAVAEVWAVPYSDPQLPSRMVRKGGTGMGTPGVMGGIMKDVVVDAVATVEGGAEEGAGATMKDVDLEAGTRSMEVTGTKAKAERVLRRGPRSREKTMVAVSGRLVSLDTSMSRVGVPGAVGSELVGVWGKGVWR